MRGREQDPGRIGSFRLWLSLKSEKIQGLEPSGIYEIDHRRVVNDAQQHREPTQQVEAVQSVVCRGHAAPSKAFKRFTLGHAISTMETFFSSHLVPCRAAQTPATEIAV